MILPRLLARTLPAWLVLALALAAAPPVALAQDPPPDEPGIAEPAPAPAPAATDEAEAEVAAEDAVPETVAPQPQARARAVSADGQRLPDPVETRHAIETPAGELVFVARAGVLTLTADDGREEADIAYTYYRLEGADPGTRPVAFVVNGGPGAASAYLQLMALGPFVLELPDGAVIPSRRPDLVENPDTWLAFTDLVFVDPVGTGFSRLVGPTDRLRERYLSMDGDIAALAAFVTRFTLREERLASPRFFVGESYGGFRGPRLAERLQREEGMALSGLVLVSPVLDFGFREGSQASPLPRMALLPSVAAAAMEKAGGIDRAALAAVEDYARSEFVVDLFAGLSDEDALSRIVARVTQITGLPRDLVRAHAGRLDLRTVARELYREEGRIASLYDANVTVPDPAPGAAFPRVRDPVLDGLTGPLTAGAQRLYREKLGFAPERPYLVLNGSIARAWRYGEGRASPNSFEALASAMALDETMRTLVVHGLTDLVTPYFESELILRQLPAAIAARVRLEYYPGGHMFYTRAESRRAFTDAARALFEGSEW